MAQSTFGQPKFARDSIGEFQFMSARFDATQGRSQGIVVNAVTKSGANLPFGSAYGYFRNDQFNAADFVVKSVLPYQNQQVGATFGGPIIRDRAHIFGYYELEREPNTFTFAGAYPAFNIAPLSVTRIEHKAGFRGDLQLSNRQPLAAARQPVGQQHADRHRQLHRRLAHRPPLDARDPEVPELPGLRRRGPRCSAAARSTRSRPAGSSAFSDQYGLPGLEESPQILLRGYTIGKSPALPLRLNGHMWSLRDDFSTVLDARDARDPHRRRHAVQPRLLRVEQRAVRRLRRTRRSGAGQRRVAVPGVERPVDLEHRRAVADCGALRPELRQVGLDQRDAEVAAWFQDNWHVSPDLTLNLGLRWDFSYNWSAKQWEVPPLRRSVPNEFDNWGPRTGFAYSLNDKKTVIRGGWGIYFIGPKDQWSHHTPANLSVRHLVGQHRWTAQLLRRSLPHRRPATVSGRFPRAGDAVR